MYAPGKHWLGRLGEELLLMLLLKLLLLELMLDELLEDSLLADEQLVLKSAPITAQERFGA